MHAGIDQLGIGRLLCVETRQVSRRVEVGEGEGRVGGLHEEERREGDEEREREREGEREGGGEGGRGREQEWMRLRDRELAR
ncbi:MAG: hypothetical protein OHK0037_15670 [Elainellaceae cyanobacterium]